MFALLSFTTSQKIELDGLEVGAQNKIIQLVYLILQKLYKFFFCFFFPFILSADLKAVELNLLASSEAK